MKTEPKDNEKVAVGILVVPSPHDVKKDLNLHGSAKIQITPGEEKDLESKANQFVKQLIDFDPTQIEEEGDRKQAVEQMALDLQKKASKQSVLLL